MITRLLSRKPEERISVPAIKSHPWMAQKNPHTDNEIIKELQLIYFELDNQFLENANKELQRKDWKRFKGFTARRSRPGSACDYQKEISDYLLFQQQRLQPLLNRFKRSEGRKGGEDLDSPLSEPQPRDSLKPQLTASGTKKTEVYSVTNMLRKYSSSSSESSKS